MCLDYVKESVIGVVKTFCDKKLKKVKYQGKTWYVGWKCGTGMLIVNNYVYLYTGSHPCNKILSSKKTQIYGPSYLSGFHICTTRQYARIYARRNVQKVLFREPRLLGSQSGSMVVIADKMIVPNEKLAKKIFAK